MCGLAPEVIADINLEQPGGHILLSFDDGGKGAVRAADELSSRGWKGHFFITTGLLGSRTFLDAKAARYLYSCGHVLGSHSHTHPDIFSALSFHQMTEEWRVSCDMLSNLVGGPSSPVRCPVEMSRGVFSSPQIVREYNFCLPPRPCWFPSVCKAAGYSAACAQKPIHHCPTLKNWRNFEAGGESSFAIK